MGLLWTTDQLVAATYKAHNKHKRQTSMPTSGLEPAIPVTEQPYAYVLDRRLTVIGQFWQ
jgi:hypothetical protein